VTETCISTNSSSNGSGSSSSRVMAWAQQVTVHRHDHHHQGGRLLMGIGSTVHRHTCQDLAAVRMSPLEYSIMMLHWYTAMGPLEYSTAS
jgi:hypothetical protein